jgi:hypothetical protein
MPIMIKLPSVELPRKIAEEKIELSSQFEQKISDPIPISSLPS